MCIIHIIYIYIYDPPTPAVALAGAAPRPWAPWAMRPWHSSCKSPKFCLEGAEEDANSQDNSTGHPPHDDQRLIAQIFMDLWISLDVAAPKHVVNEEKKS